MDNLICCGLIIQALRIHPRRTAFGIHKAIAPHLPSDWELFGTISEINELEAQGIIERIETHYPSAFILRGEQ